MDSKDSEKVEKLLVAQFHGQRGPLFDQWSTG